MTLKKKKKKKNSIAHFPFHSTAAARQIKYIQLSYMTLGPSASFPPSFFWSILEVPSHNKGTVLATPGRVTSATAFLAM
jgi:hypothetical protein